MSAGVILSNQQSTCNRTSASGACGLLPLVVAGAVTSSPLQNSTSSALIGEETTPPPSYLEQGLWAILVLGAVILAFLAYQFYRRWQEFQEQQELSDAQFEASVLAEVLGRTTTTEASSCEHENDAIPITRSTSPALKSVPHLQNSWGESVENSCRFVLDQLKQAGLLERIESYIPLPGNPQGAAVLLLKNKKRVLLLPYFETEFFTERELKRYDALIFVSRSGQGALVQSIESLIADSFLGF